MICCAVCSEAHLISAKVWCLWGRDEGSTEYYAHVRTRTHSDAHVRTHVGLRRRRVACAQSAALGPAASGSRGGKAGTGNEAARHNRQAGAAPDWGGWEAKAGEKKPGGQVPALGGRPKGGGPDVGGGGGRPP